MSYNYDTSHDSNNFTPGSQAASVYGMDRVIEGYTLHWWGDPTTNPSFEGVRDYLCNNDAQTSAHLVVTGTGRRAACIVGYENIAWHAGSAWGNARTIGIELDPRCRPEDKDVFAEVLADLRSAFGDLPLYWHSYFYNTSCPGVYRDLVDELDELSYTKYSAAEWGKGGDKNPKAPTPPPVTPTTPTTTPSTILWKLLDASGKQVAAYSTEANAWKGYVQNGKVGKITYNGKDVTSDFVSKFTTPSPTTQNNSGNTLPDSGKPVTEKDDYVEAVKENTSLMQKLIDLLKKIFNIQ